MVSFSLRQRIFLPPPTGPSPVSFHLSQFGSYEINIENFQETRLTARNGEETVVGVWRNAWIATHLVMGHPSRVCNVIRRKI